MARPRSEDKRDAILAGAAQALAAEGEAATTARIARLAGVAEGTIFTYFDSKDVLLNELYVSLKAGLRQAMLDGFPRGGSLERRVRHVWDAYIGWGLANPDGRKALRQLDVSGRIDARHRAAGAEGFGEISAMLRERLGAPGALPEEEVKAFRGALFTSLAATTMEFIARDPGSAEGYREQGFRALWAVLKAG
ncbi:TetR/AcrR family transcriptional regulator [Bordetella bronchialis]|uniref:TetR family transcriptional regulator n=1 Tax=Bordetella bronchialis TaxID=463025 RepID=A0A193FIP7_9BORD|nr:TetR/AcrR family transcriptional regulator [Bordetella bronchialis]ANN67545.1 TetR family transcriptional regulator [Bordetella bronchialis]ANN72634.1 TetR family transcriptional regulator [Bordetella bronchialis]